MTGRGKRIVVTAAVGSLPFVVYAVDRLFGDGIAVLVVTLTFCSLALAVLCYTCPLWGD